MAFKTLNYDDTDEKIIFMQQDPLLWLIFCVCAQRARWHFEPSPIGLHQGEFFLSKHEYKKFGLLESQSGQIARRLITLISLGIIKKTDRQIGHEGSSVYVFINNKSIYVNFETVHETVYEQSTNSPRAVRKKVVVSNVSKVPTKKEEIISYFNNIPYADKEKIYEKYQIEMREIDQKGEDLAYWFEKLTPIKQAGYKDPYRILNNAIGKIEKIPLRTEEQHEELKALRLAEEKIKQMESQGDLF